MHTVHACVRRKLHFDKTATEFMPILVTLRHVVTSYLVRGHPDED